jgi:hypothetical protein
MNLDLSKSSCDVPEDNFGWGRINGDVPEGKRKHTDGPDSKPYTAASRRADIGMPRAKTLNSLIAASRVVETHTNGEKNANGTLEKTQIASNPHLVPVMERLERMAATTTNRSNWPQPTATAELLSQTLEPPPQVKKVRIPNCHKCRAEGKVRRRCVNCGGIDVCKHKRVKYVPSSFPYHLPSFVPSLTPFLFSFLPSVLLSLMYPLP